MIGLFDSGLGGLATLKEIRKFSKDTDIVFFRDTENAPYGTKSRGELIELVRRDIELLCARGAEKILIGCCTASTIYKYLPSEAKRISVPIILPTAKEAARVTKNGKIGVIATRATVASDAFSRAISRARSRLSVFQKETQDFVTLVEGGAMDGRISRREFDIIYRTLLPIRKMGVDTLILGCTHFTFLERTIEECMPGVRIVSSAKCGAEEMLRCYKGRRGRGKNLFI